MISKSEKIKPKMPQKVKYFKKYKLLYFIIHSLNLLKELKVLV